MLTTVKILLGIEDNSKDQRIQTLIDIIKSRSLVYCNRTDIPVGLENLIIEKVISEYKANYGTTTLQSGEQVASGSVKSESIGDYSITYNTSGSSASSGSSTELSGMDDYKILLQAFRKIKL